MSTHSPLDSLVTVTEQPHTGTGRMYLIRRPGIGRPVFIHIMTDGYAEAIERNDNGYITAQYPVTPEFAEAVERAAEATASLAAQMNGLGQTVNHALRASNRTIAAQRTEADAH